MIDECLTGDSLVLTNEGLVRIDNPNIRGKQVLSYNDSSGKWEFKKVIRWLDQGERQTLIIKTSNREIKCTGNHLIRTDKGWIAAKDVKEGVKILSPVSVDAEPLSTNLEQMDAFDDFHPGTSSKAILTGKKHTTSKLSFEKQNYFNLRVHAGVEKSSMFLPSYKEKVEGSVVYSRIGKDIHIKEDTEFGNLGHNISLQMPKLCPRKHWDLSTEHYLGTVPSLSQINVADFPDWLGRTVKNNTNGWNTKLIDFRNCDPSYELPQTRDMVRHQSRAIHAATHNFKTCSTLLNRMGIKNSSLSTGSIELPQKVLPGGFVMMDHSTLLLKGVHKSNSIQKDSPLKKTKLLPVGLQQLAISQQQSLTQEVAQARSITTYGWAQTAVENFWQISNSIPFPQWITSLETVESVHLAGVERVYDIEVQDNHNFVANGLTVHNCHMLSTQAFNALLKTLEEPPKHVVFVLATTDPQRVLPTIISRCQRFDFRRIPLDEMVAHLSMIASQENINITREAITLVAQIAQGGLRDAESLLDQLSLLVDQVTPDRVWDLVGSVSEQDLLMLLGAIAQDNPEAVLDCTRKILDRGREPLTVLQNLASFYRDLLIAKTANNRNDLVACTQQTWKALIDFAQHLEISTILHGQQHLRTAEVQLKNTTQPRLWLEITLLGLLPSAHITIQQNSKGVIPAPKISLPQNIAAQNSPINRETPPQNTVEQRSPINHETLPQNTAEQKPPINRESPTVQPTIQQEDSPSLQNTPQEDAKPVVPAPASTSETQQEVDSSEQMQLDQIWQQVVEALSQLSSKALFKEHGRILSINNDIAQVAMPPKLVQLAQKKLADVEAAFLKACQQKIKVNFVSSQSKTSPTNEVKEPPKNNIIPQARPQPTPTDNNPINPPSQEVSKPAKTTPKPEPAKNNSKAQTLTSSPLTTTNNWETDEVAIAAQRLAQFFDGAVIRFTDDTGLPNALGTSEWGDEEDSDDD
ncbi:DNA polymerase III subunit gamma/tau [Aetokthonos hydrillicola]